MFERTGWGGIGRAFLVFCIAATCMFATGCGNGQNGEHPNEHPAEHPSE